jgi:hypothetical protein
VLDLSLAHLGLIVGVLYTAAVAINTAHRHR